MATATKSRNTNKIKEPPLQPKHLASPAPTNRQKPKLVGLAALLNAPAPGLFHNAAEIDAHIREGRGDWDEED